MKITIRDKEHARILETAFNDQTVIDFHGISLAIDERGCNFDGKTTWTFGVREVFKTKWTGEGLPPVGTVCECMLVGGSDEWVCCEIIAHKENQAVCWVDCNNITASIGPRIRPLRTPEQIAAEERQKEISTLNDIIVRANLKGIDPTLAIYDAGYRKV